MALALNSEPIAGKAMFTAEPINGVKKAARTVIVRMVRVSGCCILKILDSNQILFCVLYHSVCVFSRH